MARYANRIENAEFSVGGRKYQLSSTTAGNHLHGTFPKRYDAGIPGDTLPLETGEPGGRGRLPGNLKVSVRYILTEDNALRMDYRVSSDADTILNLTNHTPYFNLDGGGTLNRGSCAPCVPSSGGRNNETRPHRQHPASGQYAHGLPGGQDHRSTFDTGFSHHHGAAHMTTASSSTGAAGPAYILRLGFQRSDRTHEGLHHPARRPASHTANFLQGRLTPDKGGIPMQKYGGFALETQHLSPAALLSPGVPSTVLRAGCRHRSGCAR